MTAINRLKVIGPDLDHAAVNVVTTVIYKGVGSEKPGSPWDDPPHMVWVSFEEKHPAINNTRVAKGLALRAGWPEAHYTILAEINAHGLDFADVVLGRKHWFWVCVGPENPLEEPEFGLKRG